MSYKPEYILCRQIAYYLRLKHPKLIFHYDSSGLHHTKAQAGAMRGIQGMRGWPDLMIAKPVNGSAGLFLELKAEGAKLYKRNGDMATPHIQEQLDCLQALWVEGYCSHFAVGYDNAIRLIEDYLAGKL